MHAPAEGVGIDRGKIAIDAVLDVVALRVHRDSFDDIQIAVCLYSDVAGEIENALDIVLRASWSGADKARE
jgi:hypothetical protein